MAILFDSAKIVLAVKAAKFWNARHYIIASTQAITFVILTLVAIVASYIFLINMSTTKSTTQLKNSSEYKGAILQVSTAQSAVDNLIGFGSANQRDKKETRLIEIDAKILEFNNMKMVNYYGDNAGTFGAMNKCGRGQSKYNIYCPQIASLNAEKNNINKWIANNDSFHAANAVLVERKKILYGADSGDGEVVSGQLEPFKTFSRVFAVPYVVASTATFMFLSILCELLASLLFVSFSVVNDKPSPKLNHSIILDTSPGIFQSLYFALKTKVQTKLGNVQNIRLNETVRANENVTQNEMVTFKNDRLDEQQIATNNAMSGTTPPLTLSDSQYQQLSRMVMLGIVPPTIHSLRKRFKLSVALINTLQNKWLAENLIEKYQRGSLTSYRLKSKSETLVVSD